MKKYLHRYHDLDSFKNDYYRDFGLVKIICNDGEGFTFKGLMWTPEGEKVQFESEVTDMRNIYVAPNDIENLYIGRSITVADDSISDYTDHTIEDLVYAPGYHKPWVSYTTYDGQREVSLELNGQTVYPKYVGVVDYEYMAS